MSDEMYYGEYKGWGKSPTTRPSYYEYIDYGSKRSKVNMGDWLDDDPADWDFMFDEYWHEKDDELKMDEFLKSNKRRKQYDR